MEKCLICKKNLKNNEIKDEKKVCDKCRDKENLTNYEAILVSIFNPK